MQKTLTKEEEKQGTESLNFKKISDKLLSAVNPRSKEVLILRFGLKNEESKSLSAVGDKFGITRERVRQIEVASFDKLKKTKKNQEFDFLVEKATKIIQSEGGFFEKKTLKGKIKPNLTDVERRQLMFVLNCSPKLRYQKTSVNLKGYWCEGNYSKKKDIVEYHQLIFGYLKEKKQPVSFGEIKKYTQSKLFNNFFSGLKGEKRLKMILFLSRDIDKNILDEWGLKNWRIVSGRGSREKALLILRKYKEPLHFRKITILINKHWTNKKSLPQTVHNELIKDDRFVQVGKGMYGLNDWGLVGGTVREIITGYLKENGDYLTREEIVDYVLGQKRVKETTIFVNLSDQRFFQKDEQGRYYLKIA